MNGLEKNNLVKFSRVLRAGRKLRGIGQVDMARALDVSQGQVSKIEKGQMVPSAPVWFKICEVLQLPVHVGALGYIDSNKEVVVHENLQKTPFKIAERYSYLTGSMSRTSQPMLYFFQQSFGPAKVKEYFKKIKVDPDLFTVLDQPINMNFNLDLASTLIAKGKITNQKVSALSKCLGQSTIHGNLSNDFSNAKDAISLLKTLSLQMNKYEANWLYEFDFEKSNKVVIHSYPNAHLSEFQYENDSLGLFVNEYKRAIFEQFLIDYRFKPRGCQLIHGSGRMSKSCTIKIQL